MYSPSLSLAGDALDRAWGEGSDASILGDEAEVTVLRLTFLTAHCVALVHFFRAPAHLNAFSYLLSSIRAQSMMLVQGHSADDDPQRPLQSTASALWAALQAAFESSITSSSKCYALSHISFSLLIVLMMAVCNGLLPVLYAIAPALFPESVLIAPLLPIPHALTTLVLQLLCGNLLLASLVIRFECLYAYQEALNSSETASVSASLPLPALPGRLLSSGPYAVVRQPLLLSSVLFDIASFLYFPSYISLVSAAIAFSQQRRAAATQEKKLFARLGAPFESYAKRTPQLIPDERGVALLMKGAGSAWQALLALLTCNRCGQDRSAKNASRGLLWSRCRRRKGGKGEE
jgi:protein-S-isoprenylcysteine O-methyltransferase Ste14